jgi:hypothetical protein
MAVPFPPLEDLAAKILRSSIRHVLFPVARRGNVRPAPLEGGRRLVLLQLDGVSRARLEWAIANGHMPHLARRLRGGGHALSSCRSGAPSSTPAFQAGLFYGSHRAVPGYVWFDRATGREIRMDDGERSLRLDEKLARERPGLLEGGTSYFSILHGGAALRTFSLSGLVDFTLKPLCRGFNAWDHLASMLVHGVTAVSLGARLGWEVATGLFDGALRVATLGRMKHEPRFFLHRLLVAALMRELAVQGVIVDLARGVPVIYADFVAYDEFAHRRGPDAPIAVAHLRSIDRALNAIFAAAEALPEMRYDVYVFSDHGHVATEPFEAHTGLPLPDYLALAEKGIAVPRALPPAAAQRLARARGARAFVRRLRNLPAGARRLARRGLDLVEGKIVGHTLGSSQHDRIATAEAGDLAHVYFLDGEGAPADLERIRTHHPGALAALRECRAVGIVAVRGGRRGVAIVQGDELDLADPADVAQLPHPEPALLAEYLADLLACPDSGDLVVQGWRGEGKVPIAYAWEFGSHGGVAPEELHTFVVHPREVTFRFDGVRRPAELYAFFDRAYRRRRADERRAPAGPQPLACATPAAAGA